MDLRLHLIETITNNFSEDQKVGSGGFGHVYRAFHDGEEIAVKKLHPLQGLDDKEFDTEFRNLKLICHKNVVRLIGYCHESRRKYVQHNGEFLFATEIERVLCFEYMHGGSLDKHIADESCGLDWDTCYKIIRGTCEGLNHLHGSQEKPIFHLDMKPGNILLDKSMMPKIADLGLSKLVTSTKTHKTEMLKGTSGYMPPEYRDSGYISKKFDVFSLGVIIIKIMAGNKGYFGCFEMPPKQFVELVTQNWKQRLQSSEEMDIIRVCTCVEIALRCVNTDRKKRPTINDIVQELDTLEAAIKEMMSEPSAQPEDLIVQRSCDTNNVSVDPTLELLFLFEPRKEVSCCVQITNKTDGVIAFNIKINQYKYRVNPRRGTMPPCSKCYIAVTMQAQENAPSNMWCHDMLLVQSSGVTQELVIDLENIDYKKVFQMADKVIDVVKLPIVYVTLEQ
ncbi:hypothetical protein ACQ4PT_050006 [Festuca glaucescens]